MHRYKDFKKGFICSIMEIIINRIVYTTPNLIITEKSQNLLEIIYVRQMLSKLTSFTHLEQPQQTFIFYQIFHLFMKTIYYQKQAISIRNHQKSTKKVKNQALSHYLYFHDFSMHLKSALYAVFSSLIITISKEKISMLNEPKNATIEQLKVMWNSLAPIYTTFDATMQAFCYTLASMMRIPQAKHIYEVGCGIGKMIPYTLSLKNEECTYLATDLSEKMVEMSRNYLASYTYKLGLQDNFDKWMERQRLEMGVHDGECMFKPAHKFDRIICNLVLMNTADAHKMMQAMHEVADEKCLLGVSVWGDKKSSNFLNLPMQAKTSLGKPIANVRDNFYLHNKLQQLGKETGWEMVVQWEQTSPLNTFESNPELMNIIKCVSELDSAVMSYMEKKVKETFMSKHVLTFPAQMAIFRKK